MIEEAGAEEGDMETRHGEGHGERTRRADMAKTVRLGKEIRRSEDSTCCEITGGTSDADEPHAAAATSNNLTGRSGSTPYFGRFCSVDHRQRPWGTTFVHAASYAPSRTPSSCLS